MLAMFVLHVSQHSMLERRGIHYPVPVPHRGCTEGYAGTIMKALEDAFTKAAKDRVHQGRNGYQAAHHYRSSAELVGYMSATTESGEMLKQAG